jgi:4-diphosphocytidyl-2-C-methyl-D-erythritol kinase
MNFALSIGSDCPFFILNSTSFVSGRGESIENFSLDLSAYSFALINPVIHIDTSWAFSKIKPTTPVKSIRNILKEPIQNWREVLVNDFEAPVFKEYPGLNDIKKTLYSSGALYASMTGSGSSLYGIFKKNTVPSFSFDQNFRIDILK